jgi:penicillin-binding protein 1A
VEPYLIERITDRNGKLLEKHRIKAEPVISSQTAYIMTHLLSGVVEEGTAKVAKALDRPVAGKTGTTNEMKDAWFVGYTPSVLAGVWIGNDDHQVSLGKGETGGRAACPIWVSFMQDYLKDTPIETFAIPSGIVMAKMNPHTGSIGRPEDPGGTYAAFAGEPPPRQVRQYSAERILPSSKLASSSESFFKSDLY